MRSILSLCRRDGFGSARRRGVLFVMSFTLGGQLVGLLCAPILSRLYQPAAFGAFAVVSALVIVVGSASSLRLDAAIPLPASDDEARVTAYLALACSFLTCSILMLVLWMFGPQLASALAFSGEPKWLMSVPIVGLGFAWSMVLTQWMIRFQKYGRVGSRSFLQSATTAGAQTLAGGLGFLSNGLIIGLVVGQIVSTASLIGGARLFRRTEGKLSPWRILRRYRRFAVFSTPATILNTAAAQMSVVFIASWYGTSEAGLYGLAQRVVALPVVLVGAAASQVYLGELAQAARRDGYVDSSLFRRASLALLIPAALLVLVMVIAGPMLFQWVFGADWRQSGEFARALSIATAAQMVAAPLGGTLVVLEKQHVQAIWDAMRLMTMGASVYVVWILGGSSIAAVWTVSIVSFVAYVILWVSCLRALRSRMRQNAGIPTLPGA